MRRGKRIARRVRAVPRRTNTGYTKTASCRKSENSECSRAPKRFYQAIICGVLFTALVLLKLLLPGNLSEMRGTLGQWLVRDADFEEAFYSIGRAVSEENGVAEALSEAYIAVFGAQEVSGVSLAAETDSAAQSLLLAQKALPDYAVAEQQILGFSYACPFAGEVTSPFGWRIDPNGTDEEFHNGIDLAAEEGTEITCFADGTVGVVGDSTELGKYLTVNHKSGYSTLYAHCSKVTVNSGDAVQQGTVIACVGQSGNATGPHLHFEVHDAQGRYLNPVYYISP